MCVWCRDSDNCLSRIESNNLFGNLSDSFTHSHTLDIMADLESNHGDENNLNNKNFHAYQPIRNLRDYLQPTRSSAPSCIIFPTNANNFNFKPGMTSLLPKFHGLDSIILTYTLRNLRRYVLPSMTNHVMKRPLG